MTFTTTPPTPITFVIKSGQGLSNPITSTGGTFPNPFDQDISHVTFCEGGAPTTTTTGTDTTTTTGTGTTTTGKETIVVTKPSKKTASAVATASASAAAPVVQYQYKAAAPVQYQYQAPAEEEAVVLPETGGSSLLPIGAMVLLLGGGLTALLAVRRGTSG